MHVPVILMALAVTLVQASSSGETTASDQEIEEAPTRRCGDTPVKGQIATKPYPIRPFSYNYLVELDQIAPLGFHYGCSIGIPTVYGCAIQKMDGKYLVVGPLLEDDDPRVKPLEMLYPIKLGLECRPGIRNSICRVQEINGKWLFVFDPKHKSLFFK